MYGYRNYTEITRIDIDDGDDNPAFTEFVDEHQSIESLTVEEEESDAYDEIYEWKMDYNYDTGMNEVFLDILTETALEFGPMIKKYFKKAFNSTGTDLVGNYQKMSRDELLTSLRPMMKKLIEIRLSGHTGLLFSVTNKQRDSTEDIEADVVAWMRKSGCLIIRRIEELTGVKIKLYKKDQNLVIVNSYGLKMTMTTDKVLNQYGGDSSMIVRSLTGKTVKAKL